MSNEELIMSQYRLYSEQKEKFVDRAFMTNKFYMILILRKINSLKIFMIFLKNIIII